MFKVKGTYQNGTIHLDSNPPSDLPVKVIVTFPDMDARKQAQETSKNLRWNDFSFSKSRQLLKDLKSSLSEEVILERRNR